MCHLGFRNSDLKMPGRGTRCSSRSLPYSASFLSMASRSSLVKRSGRLRHVFNMCTSTYLCQDDRSGSLPVECKLSPDPNRGYTDACATHR